MKSLGWDRAVDVWSANAGSFMAWLSETWACMMPALYFMKKYLPPPMRVLEVGAGTGSCATLLAAHGYQVTASDVDPKMLLHAQNLALQLRLPIMFEQLDIFDLSPQYGQADVVFSSGLLEHFQDDAVERALDEMAKASTAGLVCVIVPTAHGTKNDPMKDQIYTRDVSLLWLCERMEDAGLQVRHVRGYGTPDRWRWLYAILPFCVWNFLQRQGFFSCTLIAIAQKPSLKLKELS